jgi:formylglycine-generating enzyme required for sulfatase activity
MVQLPVGFWIDTTEVTRAQYAAWIETNPSTSDQLPECQWNDSYTIPANYPVEDRHDHPVAGVDWCDAYAYCKGVGKRLCGKIGGGPAGIDDNYDATKSQWYYACSSGGLYEYPYGNDYDPNACNLEDSGLESTAPVASFDGCQSSEPGFEGVFDLSGNLREWVDGCSGSGAEDLCNQQSGSFGATWVTARCRGAAPVARTEREVATGFRCCRD